MLIRWTHKGSVLGLPPGAVTAIEVDGLPTGYLLAISSSNSTSYAAESSNTGSVNIESFDVPSFASLHITDGTFGIIEELTGSFVSTSLYGGDKFNYFETRSFSAIGTTTGTIKPQVLIGPFTASVIRYDMFSGSAPYYTSSGGASPTPTGSTTVVPTEGQLFPRGVYAYE